MVDEAVLRKATLDVQPLNRYRREMPLAYWRKGTIGLLKTKRGEQLLAIADMDGAVLFSRESGNTYYRERPDEQYINVCFLHKIDEYNIQPGQRPGARHNPDRNRICYVNDTVRPRDGWTLYVDETTYEQFLRDKRIEDDTATNAKKAADRDAAIKRIEAAEAELAEARRLLEAAQC